MISRPVITKVAICAQPCGPRASELGHGTWLAADEFPAKLMKVAKAGPGVQSDRNQEERPGQKAGKHSSTAQRRTLHSSVCGAACHGQKLRRLAVRRR